MTYMPPSKENPILVGHILQWSDKKGRARSGTIVSFDMDFSCRHYAEVDAEPLPGQKKRRKEMIYLLGPQQIASGVWRV